MNAMLAWAFDVPAAKSHCYDVPNPTSEPYRESPRELNGKRDTIGVDAFTCQQY
jgi:hypothetical protein